MSDEDFYCLSRAYEIALWQWGKDPQWIDDNWSEELRNLMFDRLGERLEKTGGEQ